MTTFRVVSGPLTPEAIGVDPDLTIWPSYWATPTSWHQRVAVSLTLGTLLNMDDVFTTYHPNPHGDSLKDFLTFHHTSPEAMEALSQSFQFGVPINNWSIGPIERAVLSPSDGVAAYPEDDVSDDKDDRRRSIIKAASVAVILASSMFLMMVIGAMMVFGPTASLIVMSIVFVSTLGFSIHARYKVTGGQWRLSHPVEDCEPNSTQYVPSVHEVQEYCNELVNRLIPLTRTTIRYDDITSELMDGLLLLEYGDCSVQDDERVTMLDIHRRHHRLNEQMKVVHSAYSSTRSRQRVDNALSDQYEDLLVEARELKRAIAERVYLKSRSVKWLAS